MVYQATRLPALPAEAGKKYNNERWAGRKSNKLSFSSLTPGFKALLAFAHYTQPPI